MAKTKGKAKTPLNELPGNMPDLPEHLHSAPSSEAMPGTGARSRAKARSGHKAVPDGDASVQAMIAEAAYYRAQRRDFTPGQEMQDWLEAEREIAQTTPQARPSRTGGRDEKMAEPW